MDSHEISAGNRRDKWLGITLVLTAATCWSTMGLFVRMTPGVDLWTVVFWRSIFGGLSILALTMIERRSLSLEWRRTMTLPGIATTLFIATAVFASIYSMQNTTIANGAVIGSTIPFMAAVLAWLWFRERPGTRTIVCTVIAMAGVAVTVSGTLAGGGGHLKGDLSMVYGTFALAMMTVITRRYRDTPMLEIGGVGLPAGGGLRLVPCRSVRYPDRRHGVARHLRHRHPGRRARGLYDGRAAASVGAGRPAQFRRNADGAALGVHLLQRGAGKRDVVRRCVGVGSHRVEHRQGADNASKGPGGSGKLTERRMLSPRP